METKPIKRSEYLKQLSRDHHFGLLFCWKIKEGLKKKISYDRMVKYMNFFWEGHLKNHFEDENSFLFNRKDKLCEQAKSEHLQISDQIRKINETAENSEKSFKALAQILTDHIRFEERTLFPHLEQILTEDELKAIGKHLEKEHSAGFEDDFLDQFWVA